MMNDINRYIQVYICARACTRIGEAGTPFVAEYKDGHRQGGMCHRKPHLAHLHVFEQKEKRTKKEKFTCSGYAD